MAVLVYKGVNGEPLKQISGVITINGLQYNEFKGDYTYLYEKKNKRWYYVDEEGVLHRFFQPVTVTATKKNNLLLLCGLGLILVSTSKIK